MLEKGVTYNLMNRELPKQKKFLWLRKLLCLKPLVGDTISCVTDWSVRVEGVITESNLNSDFPHYLVTGKVYIDSDWNGIIVQTCIDYIVPTLYRHIKYK